MSDNETQEEKPFAVERAKTGRAKCKRCKCPIEKGTVRIAKLVSNPFSDGKTNAWHHPNCLFEVFGKQRATTKRIDDPEEDVSGWTDLCEEDKRALLQKIDEFEKSPPFETSTSKGKRVTKKRKVATPEKESDEPIGNKKPKSSIAKPSRDDAFDEFRRLCRDVAGVDAYTEKTTIVRKRLTKGCDGDGFKGDAKLWCRMLLPGVAKRIYNLQSKQLIKLFSRVLREDEDEMLEHLEQGDVAETIRVFFEKTTVCEPVRESTLLLREVDQFLERLSTLTKEEDRMHHLRSIVSRCTPDDLKMIIRLIKSDLRINAGPKHILTAIHERAYEAFQMSRDLDSVVERCLRDSFKHEKSSSSPSASATGPSSDNKVALALMTPVLPMLAEACTSVDMAMKKCPRGMLAEVKYDGERVQVHQRGKEFRYFSRSLKPVLSHKVNLFADYIPQAFPDGNDLILDSEILMVDNKTGQPLPFGSLGIHKKSKFKDANVCLFVFDCIYYNGDVLLHKSMSERRRILVERMTEIPKRIMLSEVQEVHNPQDLAETIAKVLKLGLEGLVLKDIHGTYEPGKRHWLKVKKDYLFDGAMADSADLVVLGAWYGTGNKGGIMSVFLMGCYDEDRGDWVTVTKVHTGHDDATLAMLQDQLDMVKIGKDAAKLPAWLRANKPMIPDFVAKDPKAQPVWEITGAEFTNQGVHTADGISIRFPRVTRIRRDKDWSCATTLKELHRLFQQKADSIDFSLLLPSYTSVKQELDDASSNCETSYGKRGKKMTAETSDDQRKSSATKAEDEKRPAFYAFVNRHYIEYNAAGTPLNWSEGRKPSSGLPPDAKPLSELTDTELMSKSILRGAVVSLASGFEKSRLKYARKLLKTLGAKISKDGNKSAVAYVVHPAKEILSSAIQIDRMSSDSITASRLVSTAAPVIIPAMALTGFRLVEIVSSLNRRWQSVSFLAASCLFDPPLIEHDLFTLSEYADLPKTARHVNFSWLELSASNSEMLHAERYAVELAADYCSCPCRCH